ncbi:hypothetical protein VTN31DRAFT_6739 [Thermomyces dupontii]|uniref:uncharacterized protein n=1 Tax=Talaromyces thermophilus TaxID=28565 RepID=UPI0037446771
MTTTIITQPNSNGTRPHKANYAGFRLSKDFLIAVVSIAVFADVFIYGMVKLQYCRNLPEGMVQYVYDTCIVTRT